MKTYIIRALKVAALFFILSFWSLAYKIDFSIINGDKIIKELQNSNYEQSSMMWITVWHNLDELLQKFDRAVTQNPLFWLLRILENGMEMVRQELTKPALSKGLSCDWNSCQWKPEEI